MLNVDIRINREPLPRAGFSWLLSRKCIAMPSYLPDRRGTTHKHYMKKKKNKRRNNHRNTGNKENISKEKEEEYFFRQLGIA